MNDMILFLRDWLDIARRIEDEGDRLGYLMSVLEYAFEGREPSDTRLDLLTLAARLQIDRQREKYAEKSEKRREAALRSHAANAANAANAAINKKQEYINKKQEIKEKISPTGDTKKKAQQAAPRAGGLSSSFKELTPDAKHPAPPEEEEKNSAQKEEEPPVVAVEVVTTRTRAQPVQRFVPPTVEEVAEYCRQRQNGIDAEEFVAAYQQSGWRLKGGVPMKDWRASVITWEKYRKRNINKGNNGESRNYDNDKSVRDAEFARYWAGRVGNKPV